MIAMGTLAVLAAPAAARAQQQQNGSSGNTFDWSGAIPAGSWLRIENLNGSIDVERASGTSASVHAEKRWRRGDPADVRFAVAHDGSSVTVCALWPGEDRCDASGAHGHGERGNDHDDVSVRFTVRLPAGVRVKTNTVNGSLDVRGATAQVEANTVNGRIDASTDAGPIRARTVNGTIHVRMQNLGSSSSGDLSFSTVNGSITADLPASLDANVDMETVNGSLHSDFPITLSGRVDPHHLRATIGKGGRELRLRTVNGSVDLRHS